MFNVGDAVLYSTQGVCRIVGIEENDFGGDSIEYFVLKPVFDKSATVYVPKNNPALIGKMRSVLSEQEAQELLDTVSTADTIWTDDDGLRKQQYQEMIARGDRKELFSLIKTLDLHQKKQKAKGKHLHISDEAAFKQAKEMLFCELAFVLHTTPENVEELIAHKSAS